MASWAFILTDRNYVPQGEILNAQERKVALPLSKLSTASFKVRLDNPLADQIMTGEGYIKAYRKTARSPWSLKHFGPIITAEESGDRDKASISVNSVGAGWILSKRLAGKSGLGTVYSNPKDRALIVKDAIDAANAEIPTSMAAGAGETGISTAGAISAASTVAYTVGPYKTIQDTLNELATAFDGFDWYMDPIDNYANGLVTGMKIGSFRAAPLISALRTNAVFEWGTGINNIASYKYQVSRDTQANQVFHITTNGPAAPAFPVVSALDPDSIASWKLLEDLASADLLDTTMRQNLVQEHVKVRKTPRKVIEFTPHIDPSDAGRLPVFGLDFDVGDQVRARIGYNRVTRFDATVRVYGVTFDINDLGIEQQTLSLVQES